MPITMNTVNASFAPTIRSPHGVKVSELYATEHAQVVHITLEAGESLKKHITPVDVFFYVLEGTDAVALGQMTPKPLLVTATFVGYRLGSQQGGGAGQDCSTRPSRPSALSCPPSSWSSPRPISWRSSRLTLAFSAS
jgi:hypothetical protein